MDDLNQKEFFYNCYLFIYFGVEVNHIFGEAI